MVKIGDFGIAKVLDTTAEQAKTVLGTPYFMSPELTQGVPYGKRKLAGVDYIHCF